MTSTKVIAAAVNAVPAKMENLRKALDDLQSHSSSLASFTLQWKELEDHFASIEKSIEKRFKELESLEISKLGSAGAASPAVKSAPLEDSDEESEVEPRPELKSLCVKLDGKGLVAFINASRTDLTFLKKEIRPALRSASDPAKLVLDALEGFYPAKSPGTNSKNQELHLNRRTCILLLESLRAISPVVKGPIKERAKKLALEWKEKMSTKGDVASEALAFLQLVASCGLTSEFSSDDLLDLIVLFSRRKQAVGICKDLGLGDKVPDLIEKLNSKGKHLDAVKFVYAFELVDKYPPVPLLKAYIKESKKAAQEVRKKGNNSLQSQNEAIAKEIAALRSITKAIEDHHLESNFPRENLDKRITQLEQQKKDKKRNVQATAAPNSKPQQQQSSKRPRQSTTITTPSASSAAHAAHTVRSSSMLAHSQPHHGLNSQTYLGLSSQPHLGLNSQPHVGLSDRAQYLISAGPYSLTGTSSLYDHPGSGQAGNPLGLASRSPSRSYAYSSEALMTSGLYNQAPMSYPNYPSLHGGLPPSYNSSGYH